ncbi:FG-GAP-like repeat-containing protein [Crateriforma conspicua]|uniref:FG-GAP repeat protein n=1 Tax=Crateriforma conspicua TaxID=2527996 RepID=A0A5C5YCB7_9PLAN|nr:FG-GAP-like repeat-containing protein [Crateriforma conspicua]TWT72569.1 FG-GAP repeat protein [Crateriforma conspicua]
MNGPIAHPQLSKPHRPRTTSSCVAVLCFVSLCSFFLSANVGCNRTDESESTTSQRRPESFRTKFSALKRAKNWDAADELVLSELIRRPDDPDLLLAAAQVSLERRDWDSAIERFNDHGIASENQSRTIADPVLLQWSQAFCNSGRLIDATEVLADHAEKSSHSADLYRRLAELYSIVGDLHASQAQLHQLVRQRQIRGDELYFLASLKQRYKEDPNLLRLADTLQPDDLRPQLSQAVGLWMSKKPDAALEITAPIVREHDDYAPAIGFHAFLLAESGRLADLAAFAADHPPTQINHPDLWYGAGIAALAGGQSDWAAKCFAESLLAAEHHSHLPATQLAVSLSRGGHESLSQQVADRAKMLQELYNRCLAYFEEGLPSQANSIRIAEILWQLGRHDEAVGWSKIAGNLQHDPADDLTKRQAAIEKTPPRQRWASTLSDFAQSVSPPDEIASLATSMTKPRSDSGDDFGEILLVDETQSRGLEFQFDTGEPTGQLAVWLHQINGGGIAAADFDRDGWDDAYLSQAGSEPLKPSPITDQLFLNRDGDFQRASLATKLDDYGQGVAAGDINADGFPDLFIGNIGPNRILINNGDGQFTDVTDASGIRGSHWTSSVAIADINDDAIADLIEINYCVLDDVLNRPCHSYTGVLGACPPVDFDGDPDKVWLGNGDGTFRLDESWSSIDQAGRGLGLVVADLDATNPGLEVFVSNDMSANHFWRRQNNDTWSEEAVVRGLGYGVGGRAQACMGIAVADPDADADLDLVVTNFSEESNNFFVQQSPGLFGDQTQASGLSGPSTPVLGFGVVMSDFDADNRMDLFVTNGHVNQPIDPNDTMAQYSQLFRYDQSRWFLDRQTSAISESAAEDAQVEHDQSPNGYFAQKHVGRTIATADFDRDGRLDMMVGHLGEPTRLLMNRSPQHGRVVSLSLVGTNSHRDAVGGRIEVKTDRRTVTGHRIAGYGYYCTNTSDVGMIIGKDEMIQEIAVTWPSGIQDSFVPEQEPSTFTVIEGQGSVARIGPR